MGKKSCGNCSLMVDEEKLSTYRGRMICEKCNEYLNNSPESAVDEHKNDFFPKGDKVKELRYAIIFVIFAVGLLIYSLNAEPRPVRKSLTKQIVERVFGKPEPEKFDFDTQYKVKEELKLRATESPVASPFKIYTDEILPKKLDDVDAKQ